MPESLLEQLYLVAIRPEKHRIASKETLSYAVRAAALTELLLRGHLTDENGRPALTSAAATGHPVLDAVRDEISSSPPRSWRHWIQRNRTATLRHIKDVMATSGLITVSTRRILGVLPVDTITVLNTKRRDELLHQLHSTFAKDTDPYAISPEQAALAALAAAAELATAFTRQERKAHKHRIAQLLERTGAAGPALKKVIADLRTAQASAASSGA